MNVIFLKDLDGGEVDGVIIAYETTEEEIADIFKRIKEEKPGAWTNEDIESELPTDCSVYWTYDCGSIYY